MLNLKNISKIVHIFYGDLNERLYMQITVYSSSTISSSASTFIAPIADA